MLEKKFVCRYGLKVLEVCLAAFCVSGSAYASQGRPACHGPAELEKVIASHPTAASYDALGAYFGERKEFPCAFQAFESALRLEPNSWEAHYNLALALLQSGDRARAVGELRTAARVRPQIALTHVTLGVALDELGQKDAAMASFQAALKLEPKSVPALQGLTKALIDQKRYAAAIALLKNAPPDDSLQIN